MEIRDWWVAREIDVQAAVYLHEEESKREVEREQRDRDFWISMFGGKSQDSESTLEDVMANAPFGNR
jgi:hypothetical protein